MSIACDKKKYRKLIDSQLKSISENQKQIWSESVQSHVLSSREYNNATCIMIYSALSDEVATKKIIQNAITKNKIVVLPRCEKNSEIALHCICDYENDLALGAYKILEPKKELEKVSPEKIDIAFIPIRAFDNKCRRLGRGAGYYDRFLPTLRSNTKKIGLAFSLQEIDAIPVNENDFTLDNIITQNGFVAKG